MIPSIPRERLLAPLDPVRDFRQGKAEILLSTDPNSRQWEDLRDEVVASNFSRTEPYVLHCPKPTRRHRFSPASRWENIQLTITKMRADETLWGHVVILVCMVVALLGLSKLALWYIARQKQRLAEGGWWVEIRRNGFLVDSRPFSQVDVDGAYMEVGIYGLLSLFCSVLPITLVTESVQQAYRKVRQGAANGEVYVLQLERKPPSGAALAASMAEGETVKNTMSQEDLSKKQVSAPRMITISRYVTNVRGMILRVLERTPQSPLKLRHPFEDRDMMEAEQEKFLTDCANIFSVDREKLLACWQTKAPVDALNKAVNMHPEFPRDDMEKHLDGLWRNWAFMHLLPGSVWVASCRDWPIPPWELRSHWISQDNNRRPIQTLSEFMDRCLHVRGLASPNLLD